jgi:DNA end-binding protein Ku
MVARAIWQGVITFKGVSLPVKLYSAVVDRAVHFHLLHKPDHVRLEQRMVNPRTGEVVPNESIAKAFPVSNELLVLVDKSDLEQLTPAPTRKIEIQRFVPSDAISPEWYDRPYYLGPSSDSEQEYYAFAAALAHQGDSGIARWVMRKREYAGALCSESGHLLLATLHSAREVISLSQLDAPTGRDLLAEEKNLAKRLVESLAGTYQPKEYHDEYQQRVQELIDAKRKGKRLKAPRKIARKPAAKSLAESLRQSLQAAGSR